MIVLVGHIWLPHFPFSLTRAPNGNGNSVLDDLTGHCHQVTAPFSSPPTPSTPRTARARLCVSHSGTQLVCQPAKTLSRPGCRAGARRSCQGKQAELPYSPPDVVQHVQKGGNRKISSPKQHQLHLTSAHPCHETTYQLFEPSFSFGTGPATLPAQPGTTRGASAAIPGPQRTPNLDKTRLDTHNYEAGNGYFKCRC